MSKALLMSIVIGDVLCASLGALSPPSTVCVCATGSVVIDLWVWVLLVGELRGGGRGAKVNFPLTTPDEIKKKLLCFLWH